MASSVGDTQGKSRSASTYNATPLGSLNRQLVNTGGLRDLTNSLLSQYGEALRTGGIGAQTPIVAQSVGSAQSALSDALKAQTGNLAASGLARTPYGQQQLAQTRMGGLQGIAAIPTDYAQQMAGQAPAFSQGLMGQILQTLRKTSQSSGPYST